MKPKTQGNRGWVTDQLILIGQYEAQMSHIDEKLNDIWTDFENHGDNEALMEKRTQELAVLYEIQKDLYTARKEAEQQIFDVFPEADKTYWCLIKHAATSFVIAEENFHARGCDSQSESVMLKAASNLAKTTGLALRFEPYGCLRCLGEQIRLTLEKDEKDESPASMTQ